MTEGISAFVSDPEAAIKNTRSCGGCSHKQLQRLERSDLLRGKRGQARFFDEITTDIYALSMMTAFAEEAVRIHDQAHVSYKVIAEAVGAAPSTVRDWLSGRSSPTGVRARRLADLGEMTDRLARVMEPDYIPVWLLKPIEALDDRRPVELIARGQARRVARVISGLESPGAS